MTFSGLAPSRPETGRKEVRTTEGGGRRHGGMEEDEVEATKGHPKSKEPTELGEG